MTAATATMRVGLRADACPSIGVGHVTRLLALADETRSRGWQPVFLGSVQEVPWLAESIAARGLEVVPADASAVGLAEQVEELGCAAVVLDGYDLDRSTGAELRARGVTVMTVQDGDFGSGQSADLVLDQNVGAGADHVPEGARALLGLRYALFRDEVLAARDLARREQPAGGALRGLVFAGGTDPSDSAPTLSELVLGTGTPVVLTVVAVRDSTRAALEALPLGDGQRIEIIAPTAHLAEHAVAADFGVIAAGSSLWELLCLGVPAAVVAVADNQLATLDAIGPAAAALSLGRLTDLYATGARRTEAQRLVGELVRSGTVRATLSRRARDLVDGRGRGRVVDAVESLLAARAGDGPPHRRGAPPG